MQELTIFKNSNTFFTGTKPYPAMCILISGIDNIVTADIINVIIIGVFVMSVDIAIRGINIKDHCHAFQSTRTNGAAIAGYRQYAGIF